MRNPSKSPTGKSRRSWWVYIGIGSMIIYRTTTHAQPHIRAASPIAPNSANDMSTHKMMKSNSTLSIPLSALSASEDEVIERTRAIVAIAMGTQAVESRIVERFVWSAVHQGKWRGPIVVVHDAQPDRYAQLRLWTENFVEIHPPRTDYSTKHEQIQMVHKRFKTYVLEYLNLDPRLRHVQTVYYLDIDIVFASPILPMMRTIETRYGIGGTTTNHEPNGSTGRMWMFRGNTKRWAIQGGQMILDRATSQPCLEQWRRHMDNNLSAGKDQLSLNMIIRDQEQHVGVCEIIRMEQDGHIIFPERRDVEAIGTALQDGLMNRTYPPLVHIRNSSTMRQLKPKIWRRFVQDILGVHEARDTLGITEKMLF